VLLADGGDPDAAVWLLLLAAGGVCAGGLEVTVRIAADPDVLPCGWNHQLADPQQRFRVGDSLSLLIDVRESPAAADPAKAGA